MKKHNKYGLMGLLFLILSTTFAPGSASVVDPVVFTIIAATCGFLLIAD